MEGPHPLPEPGPEAEPGTGRRCGRHPAQRITGVCSSCLVERLASVRSPAHPEIVEVASSSSSASSYPHPDAHADCSVSVPVPGDQDQGKLHKTLMLLFQMDDSGADRQGASRPPEAEDPDRTSEANRPGGARGTRWKGASWLRAILPRRGARRRGNKEEEPSRPSHAVDPHPGDVGGGEPSPLLVERRASFRRSCEWMVCREPPSGRGRSSSLDPPRHSWDGSMVGRAFACSFACLDDPPDGVTRVRQSNAEESAGEIPAAGVAADSRNGDRAAGVAPESRNGGHSADVGGEGPRFRERRSCSDAGPEITAAASGVRRRRSNRWSRVWDRSITSPLKEFVRKGEHALDRSFSESRRETRRCKNGETADIENGEIQHGRNGSVLPGRASQGSSRSSQAAAANGDAHNFRADWLKNKECRIGRSRSVHYTSPGNFDNGMLRFYLTPMRSNRSANRGRRRSSRLFGRGLFGFV